MMGERSDAAYDPGASPAAGTGIAVAARDPAVQFPEHHWDTLVARIRAGACTPIIGAGACWPLLKTGAQLSRTLAERWKYPFPDRENLARVAQFIAVQSQDELKPKEEIRQILKTDLATIPTLPPDLVHNPLALFRAPIYLTTNYDDLMQRALRERPGVTPRSELCRWNRLLLEQEASAFDTGFQPTSAEPVVFHLHGALGLAESMVATEDDYLDFLVNVAKDLSSSPVSLGNERRAALPLPVRRALTRTTLLFVGYSLADVNFRVILRALVGSLDRANRKLSVTLQLLPDAREHENVTAVRDYLERYFAWTLDLQVCWGDAAHFGAELSRRLAAAEAAP